MKIYLSKKSNVVAKEIDTIEELQKHCSKSVARDIMNNDDVIEKLYFNKQGKICADFKLRGSAKEEFILLITFLINLL